MEMFGWRVTSNASFARECVGYEEFKTDLALEDEIFGFLKRVLCVVALPIYNQVLTLDLLGIDSNTLAEWSLAQLASSLYKKRETGFFPHTHAMLLAYHFLLVSFFSYMVKPMSLR